MISTLLQYHIFIFDFPFNFNSDFKFVSFFNVLKNMIYYYYCISYFYLLILVYLSFGDIFRLYVECVILLLLFIFVYLIYYLFRKRMR